jgi:hypothetical protein
MPKFRRYQHISKYNRNDDFYQGEVYVFPKIDGTNASIWMDDNGVLCAGSRNRQLTAENDNAGFYKYVMDNKYSFEQALRLLDNCTLYGEFLKPHTIKDYRDSAWGKFYLFDVFSHRIERYFSYYWYMSQLESIIYPIKTIAPLTICKGVIIDPALFNRISKNNTYLMKDGFFGEGVVLKNYDSVNQEWVKIISNEFKEKHIKTMGCPVKNTEIPIEQKIVEKFVSKHLVEKTFAKIATERNGFESKYIPQLLRRIYHDILSEEMPEIVKKFKYPTINFKLLSKLCNNHVKTIKPEVF